MSIKIAGNTGTIAEVTSRNQIKVIQETDIANHPEAVGGIRTFSENDPGALTGVPYLKSGEISPDFRTRVGVDTILFEDTFNATAQNTGSWSYVFATLTAAQPGAGTVNFSAVQGTTSSHGAHMKTFQYFPFVNTAPLAVEFTGGSFVAPMVSGEIWIAGLGIPASAILPPTDGVFWKLTSAGLEGIIKFNNTETSTGIIYPFLSIKTDVMAKYVIIIGEREIEWWVDDVLLAEQNIPTANGIPFLGGSAPLFMQKYNTGAVSNTNQIRVSRCGVTLMDIASNKPWEDTLGSMGRHSSVGQNGQTQGMTAGNYGGTAAIPTTQAGSNTAPNAAMAGLGGVFQMTAQAGTAAASGDMIASYFLNPAGTINITGRNLIINGVRISAINYGAVVATTPTTLLWGVSYGNVAVTLATTESASFATGTTHAPRKIPIGFMTVPVGAAIGATYDKELYHPFKAPICIRPGEYLGTTVRFIVGTATASQTVLYTVAFDGYWE